MPTDKPAVMTTQTPVQPTQPPASLTGDIVLNLSGLAKDQTVKMIDAGKTDPTSPWMEISLPHHLVTLQGYTVSGSSYKPQIFVYSVADLAAANENTGKMAADLGVLIEHRKPGDSMPIYRCTTPNR